MQEVKAHRFPCKDVILAALVCVSTAVPAGAQFARQEVIAFESAMMPVEDVLTGKKEHQ